MRRKETSTDRKLLASQYNNYLIRDKYTEIRTVKLELQYKFKRQLNMAKFKVSHQFSLIKKCFHRHQCNIIIVSLYVLLELCCVRFHKHEIQWLVNFEQYLHSVQAPCDTALRLGNYSLIYTITIIEYYT